MADIEISPARLELSRQSLEGMVNGRKFQIRDKLAAAAKRNNDSGLEESISAAYGCFSVIDVAWNRLVQTGILDKVSPKAAVFSSYLGADYGLSRLDNANGGSARIGERSCFTNERADFSKMYPLFLEDLLSTYSRAIDSQAGIGLGLLSTQYFSWIKERALSEAERIPNFERELSGIKGSICGSYEFSGMMRRNSMQKSKKENGEEEFVWENFGGYNGAVDYFKELELIIGRWEYCLSLGTLNRDELVPKGILLAGPPGTGKTRLARTFCNEAGVPFEMIGVSDVGSSFVYETSNNMQRKFDAAASYIRNKESPVSVLFIDELDSLGRAREGSPGGGREDDKVVNVIAQNMDGPKSVAGVMVIGTTNIPEAIDSCLVRGKRFEKTIYLGPVTRDDAKDIFSKYLGGCPGVDIGKVVEDYVADPGDRLGETRNLGENYNPEKACDRRGEGQKRLWTGAMIASLVSSAKRRRLIDHLKNGTDYRLATGDLRKEIEAFYNK